MEGGVLLDNISYTTDWARHAWRATTNHGVTNPNGETKAQALIVIIFAIHLAIFARPSARFIYLFSCVGVRFFALAIGEFPVSIPRERCQGCTS